MWLRVLEEKKRRVERKKGSQLRSLRRSKAIEREEEEETHPCPCTSFLNSPLTYPINPLAGTSMTTFTFPSSSS